LGQIPLVDRMPVMIMQNFDVPGGIVYGTVNTVKSICYAVNEFGERKVSSCII
ncbi:hypothetical protein AGABI2DRAFT_56716, partial [Agaricus bisporus var. bisporus H97]|uniref:hypothetical protein n=1 Tax=Agaricus bisporus var. bisporus (strain H97 / ATCC MYA-4626 / FGSC 10389) TaxID=936046 RepID=UPI00029F760A